MPVGWRGFLGGRTPSAVPARLVLNHPLSPRKTSCPTRIFAGKCSLPTVSRFFLRKQTRGIRMHSIPRHAFAALILFFLFADFDGSQAQTSLPYQKPPQAIIDLVDTRPTPGVE